MPNSKGGALNAIGNISQEAGHMKFESCRASSGGAGVAQPELAVVNAKIVLEHCSRSINARFGDVISGAISSVSSLESSGVMEFSGCQAQEGRVKSAVAQFL